jgi:uncharacterized protein (DUF934 family)
MNLSLSLIAAADHAAQASAPGVLILSNDADVSGIALDGVTRIDLHFPSFADGRAFSQAFLLRRRRGYTGEIRATGDVLIDQLVQMQRTGFSSAVLRADQNADHAARQFARYARYYQGDAVTVQPRFKEATSA